MKLSYKLVGPSAFKPRAFGSMAAAFKALLHVCIRAPKIEPGVYRIIYYKPGLGAPAAEVKCSMAVG